MSDHPELPLPQKDLGEDAAVPSTEPSQGKELSKSLFQGYVDLDAESSGIFGSLDIETAKQIIRRTQL